MVSFDVMSRSPVVAWFSPLPSMVNVEVPAGRTITSGPTMLFASMIAARRVHLPAESAHVPSPGLASTVSAVLFTVKLALWVGWGWRNHQVVNVASARTSKKPMGSNAVPGNGS